MDLDVRWSWEDLGRALHAFGNAADEITDDAMRAVAEIAAGEARRIAPGSLSALVEVEHLGPGAYAVVGRKRSGGSDEQVFNMHTHGTLSRRVKKKKTGNADRPGGIRPKRILTRARTRAARKTPDALVDALMAHGRASGFAMKRGA